jgi:hypothetical protein
MALEIVIDDGNNRDMAVANTNSTTKLITASLIILILLPLKNFYCKGIDNNSPQT